MATLEIEDVPTGYRTICEYVLTHGRSVAPRGMPTFEVPDAVIVINDPTRALPVGIDRGVNLGLAAVEAIQLIGGFSDPQLMVKIAPNTANFLNEGIFHGAYGPRLRPQLPAVIRRLHRDPDTRQAVAMIWDPARDLYVEGIKDYPCTCMFDFMIRDGKLELHTTMRSNDVWWGCAYDFFMFTQLQLSVATWLGVPVGKYFHHAISLHVYEKDIPAIRKLSNVVKTSHPDVGDGLGWSCGYDEYEDVMQWIRALPYSRTVVPPNRTSEWYAELLQPHTKES